LIYERRGKIPKVMQAYKAQTRNASYIYGKTGVDNVPGKDAHSIDTSSHIYYVLWLVCSESLAFATEPVLGSLVNLLGNCDRLPVTIQQELKVSNLYPYSNHHLSFPFLEQELIAYRYLSSCCCSCSCWGDRFQQVQGSVVSNMIGMKFSWNVLKYIRIDWFLINCTLVLVRSIFYILYFITGSLSTSAFANWAHPILTCHTNS